MSSSDLEQQETPESKSNGISRREVMKRGLVIGGATYVVPAVVSMVSPLSAFAATPTPTPGAGLNLVPCTVVLQRVVTQPVLVGVTGTVIGVLQEQSQSQTASATATASSTIAVRVTLDTNDLNDDDLDVVVFNRRGNQIPGLGRRFRRDNDGRIVIDVQGTADAESAATTVQVQNQKQIAVGGAVVPVGTILYQAVVVPCIIAPTVVLPIGTVTQTVTQTVTRTQTAMLPDCRVTLVPVTTIPGLVGVGTVVAQGQNQGQNASASASASSNFDVTIRIEGLGRRRPGRAIGTRELLECLATLNSDQVAAFIALRAALAAVDIDILDLDAADLFALLRLNLTGPQRDAILAINVEFTTGNLAFLLGTPGTPGLTLTRTQAEAIVGLRRRGQGGGAGLGLNIDLADLNTLAFLAGNVVAQEAIRAFIRANRPISNADLIVALTGRILVPAVAPVPGLLSGDQIAVLVRLGRAAVRAFLGLSGDNRRFLATLSLEQISCLLELTFDQLTALGRLTTTELGLLASRRAARVRVFLRLLNGGTQVGDADEDAEVDEEGNITIRVTGSANAAANAVGVQVQTQEQEGVFQLLGVPAGTVLFTAVVNTPCTLR